MSFLTQRPAVSPAVPRAIDSDNESPKGFFITHSGTLIYSEKPPEVFIPKSYPVTITSSPTLKFFDSENSTIPAASIPGVWG